MLNSEAKCTSTHNGTLMRTRAHRFNTKHLNRHLLAVTGQSVSSPAAMSAALFTRELVPRLGHRASALPVSSYR
jgi:hypothetical protein